MANLFLTAAKKKYRFKTPHGDLNVEQLFQLSRTELDELYVNLDSQVQKSKGLLGKKSGNDLIKDKLQIVHAVFKDKEDDAKASIELGKKKELKDKIAEVLDQKESDKLNEKSSKELRKMLKAL